MKLIQLSQQGTVSIKLCPAIYFRYIINVVSSTDRRGIFHGFHCRITDGYNGYGFEFGCQTKDFFDPGFIESSNPTASQTIGGGGKSNLLNGGGGILQTVKIGSRSPYRAAERSGLAADHDTDRGNFDEILAVCGGR